MAQYQKKSQSRYFRPKLPLELGELVSGRAKSLGLSPTAYLRQVLSTAANGTRGRGKTPRFHDEFSTAIGVSIHQLVFVGQTMDQLRQVLQTVTSDGESWNEAKYALVVACFDKMAAQLESHLESMEAARSTLLIIGGGK